MLSLFTCMHMLCHIELLWGMAGGLLHSLRQMRAYAAHHTELLWGLAGPC